jgi:excisionase family DNA binding protein
MAENTPSRRAVSEQPTSPLLSVEQLAAYLQVPVPTLYQWRHKGTGPRGLRVGRHVRYRRVDVEEWVARQAEYVG